ncbi:MAG: endonuclease [Lachnospiraceae bacterium]|nr:endonuclease [Lachnospiraceae bacterium]
MKNAFRRAIRALIIILCVIIAAFAALLVFLSVTEYKPQDTESIVSEGIADASRHVEKGGKFRIVSWNIGYGALGDNADFFMDGGSHVYTASKARVAENMEGITSFLDESQADFILLQEVDLNSSRSYGTDERKLVADSLAETGQIFENAFACNFDVLFVPYPLPPIGRVRSGIVTFTSFPSADSSRIQLPISFSWPVRMANLKRCLLVTRIPIEGSEKELVLINLHLEAYDSGEGKEKQTRMLVELLDSELSKGNYVIAGGDFNQTFSDITNPFPVYEDTWQPRLLEAEALPKSVTPLMDVAFPSCRSLDKAYEGADHGSFQYYIIDGFLVSGNIEVSQFHTEDLNFVNSDHNPVVLDFVLK